MKIGRPWVPPVGVVASLLPRAAGWTPRSSAARMALCRWLARTGQRAAALWLSHECDAVVLSELGMHLSAVERLRPTDATPREALARVRSLAATGAVHAALEAARTASARWPARESALIGPVLAADTACVAALLARHPLLRAARRLADGDAAAAQAALEDAPATEATPDALLLRAAVARSAGRHGDAARALERAFTGAALRPVHFDPARRGIAALACAPAAGAPADGPTVSIVMPVRDVAAYLPAALASVLAQDHRALEVLVVDDGSADGTAAIAERIASDDPRVRVLRAETPQGPYAARNRGLGTASGEYVSFHDGDDWSHPQKIALQLEALQRHPEAAACVSDWVRMDDRGVFGARQVYPLQRMNTSSLLMRRSAVRAAGLFDRVRAGADGEYQARLDVLLGPGAVLRVRRLLSIASWRNDSLTHDPTTGYGSPQGRMQRLLYWEAWNRWHAQAWGRRDRAQLRLDGRTRPFPVPVELLESSSCQPGNMDAEVLAGPERPGHER